MRTARSALVIDIHWTQRGKVPNLPEMQANLEKHGGAIVQYEIVFSAILFSRTTKHLEWVPSYRSRSGAGFKYALWCLAIGWWSLSGLFLTPAAVVNNLMGGVDVTGIAAPASGSFASQATTKREIRKSNERFGLVMLGLFLLIIGAILLIVIHD